MFQISKNDYTYSDFMHVIIFNDEVSCHCHDVLDLIHHIKTSEWTFAMESLTEILFK